VRDQRLAAVLIAKQDRALRDVKAQLDRRKIQYRLDGLRRDPQRWEVSWRRERRQGQAVDPSEVQRDAGLRLETSSLHRKDEDAGGGGDRSTELAVAAKRACAAPAYHRASLAIND
jgi:hypothetical protein